MTSVDTNNAHACRQPCIAQPLARVPRTGLGIVRARGDVVVNQRSWRRLIEAELRDTKTRGQRRKGGHGREYELRIWQVNPNALDDLGERKISVPIVRDDVHQHSCLLDDTRRHYVVPRRFLDDLLVDVFCGPAELLPRPISSSMSAKLKPNTSFTLLFSDAMPT